jgi:hypothetical protein
MIIYPNTTEHNQSLKTLAEQKEATAKAAWEEAKERYENNPCTPNGVRLVQKLEAYKYATSQREQAAAIYKHNHLMGRRIQ